MWACIIYIAYDQLMYHYCFFYQMGYLEEIWNGKLRSGSSEISSPKWHIERRCLLPMNDAIVETKVKGNLVDRLRFLEQHVLQVTSSYNRPRDFLFLHFSGKENTQLLSNFGI